MCITSAKVAKDHVGASYGGRLGQPTRESSIIGQDGFLPLR